MPVGKSDMTKTIKSRIAGFFWILLFVIASSGFIVSSSFAQGPASVSELAARLSGAVVNIGTSRHYQGSQGTPFPSLPQGSPLREMFDDLNPNSGQGDEAMREARSLGSGFIVSADGLIVTNNHVIEGADEILIYTDMGSRYVAELVGADAKTDLAVLRISTDDPLPFVEFGNSDEAEVGDWVMAIGNPFGLGGSVSLGIVSARNRDINSGPYDDFIQTDAAINLGNSGGPLFDMNGEVVGIVTAIVARGGNSRGIGFAVPVNLAAPIIDQLKEYGETRRGWLGVGIQEVTEEMAASLGQSAAIGALVVEVTRGGPSQGIIEPGDVIMMFDGKPIIETRDLPRIVAQTPVGSSSLVQVFRDRKLIEVRITLGQLEIGELMVAAARIDSTASEGTDSALPVEIEQLLGFSLIPLTPDVLTTIDRGKSTTGVFVSDVVRESPAFKAGVRSGRVLSEVDGIRIGSVEEFKALFDLALERDAKEISLVLSDSDGLKWNIDLPLE